MIRGIAASPGIGIGNALVLIAEENRVRKYHIPESEIEGELERFHRGLEQSIDQLQSIKSQLKSRDLSEHIRIFDVQLQILADTYLWEDLLSIVKEDKVNVEWALHQIKIRYTRIFAQIEDEVFREKRSDIHDVIDRVMSNIQGTEPCQFYSIPENTILVAQDLAPSITTCLELENLAGFVTEMGGKTSHVTILARSLEIPAVVAAEGVLAQVEDGDKLIIDGMTGNIIIEPSEAITHSYTVRKAQMESRTRQLMKKRELPARTLDGYRVKLAANVELLMEVKSVVQHGGDGIGLYRTEFLYMNHLIPPSEEEQWQNYSQLANKIYPHSAVIRTLDAGGDKFVSGLKGLSFNDFMGLRAIRLCLNKLDLFRDQLRAIIRANAQKNLKLLFPMISGIDELRQAIQFLKNVEKDLRSEGETVNSMELGIMIEVPAAAKIANALAAEVDFFSIGTNDLIQYLLAIKRVNREVAYLYEPLHPAVIRTIAEAINGAHEKGIWVSVCGEMAGEPFYTPLLLGLGVDELSMNAHSIPLVKELIRACNFNDARKLAAKLITMTDIDTIKKEITSYLQSLGTQFSDISPPIYSYR